MSALVLLAFLLSGALLGLLGGGGSILAVPLFVHGVGLAPRQAIASSLVVVGAAAFLGMLGHASRGRVRWRAGLGFAASAMLGSFLGGRLAGHLPEEGLLLAFAGLMVLVGLRMLREPSAPRGSVVLPRPSLVLAMGLGIGLTTGTLGAGGGFLVVPALALGLGLPMPEAVGTSLLVVALNSAAGFLGYLGHTAPALEPLVAALAATGLGIMLGTWGAGRLPEGALRRAFGVLVLAVAAALLASLPGLVAAVPPPWPAPLAGLAIGLFVLGFARFGGRRLGVSSGFHDACRAVSDPALRSSWRLPFLVGIVAGGWLAARVAGAAPPGFEVPLFDAATGLGLPAKALLFTLGGAFLGYGARMAGGCTSGHAIVGCSQLRPYSALAAGLFFLGAVLTTRLVLQGLPLLGG